MSIATIGVNAGVARTSDETHRLNTGATRHAVRTDDAVQIVRKLRAKLEAYQRRRARRAGWIRRFIPTGLGLLDAALPHGGLPCGAVTEILADGLGVGSLSLAMRIARQSTRSAGGCARAQGVQQDHRSIVFVDTLDDFHPPAAWQHGIAPDRLIVLRVRDHGDALWAVDQSLRCPAVAAVIAPLSRLDQGVSRRLQLAAESSGSLGVILASARERQKSFAAVRMLIERVAGFSLTRRVPLRGTVLDSPLRLRRRRFATPRIAGSGVSRTTGEARDDVSRTVPQGDVHLCRITLLTVREGKPTEPLLVDLHHETGAWPVHSVPVDRPAAKTG